MFKKFKNLSTKFYSNEGFTLLEVMMVVVITLIVMAVIWSSFSILNKSQVIDKEVKEVSAIINDARQRTLFSKNDSTYGVHFETNQVVLFKGTTYSAGDTNNEIKSLNSLVTITNISLSGGGSDVVFNRLTGSTAKSGTITFTLGVSPGTVKTITISGTGITNTSN